MKIKIGGLDYDVIEEPNLCAEDGTRRLNGHIVYDRCQIKIDNGLNPQAKNITMWHEIIHGILTHAGVKDHDETHIEVLSYGLDQVLRDNPYLRQYYDHHSAP